MPVKTINAKKIIDLLSDKHGTDVFVPECKDGPTQGCSHVRMDAWVMVKSWTKMSCIGYEVKVSRSDFLGDNKWQQYLPLCNQFAFVCPTGLIQPEELPVNVGLYWVAKTGTMLRCKRKPVFRDVKIPASVWQYILMCRTKITRETEPVSDKEFWERWLRDKHNDYLFGHRVSKSIRKEMNERIDKVSRENKDMLEKLEMVKGSIEELKKAGIDIETLGKWSFRREVRRKIREVEEALPEGLIRTMKAAEEKLAGIREILAPFENNGEEDDE